MMKAMGNLIGLISGSVLLFTASAHAQSMVYVENNTSYTIQIEDVVVSGDPISKKAWKKGKSVIAEGNRDMVLSLNRSGKVNWMDPTPRFIEPGKTAIFSTILSIADAQPKHTLKLKQKLFGTGKSSKMWYAIEGAVDQYDWELGETEFQGVWQLTATEEIHFSYRAFKKKGDAQLEYKFTNQAE